MRVLVTSQLDSREAGFIAAFANFGCETPLVPCINRGKKRRPRIAKFGLQFRNPLAMVPTLIPDERHVRQLPIHRGPPFSRPTIKCPRRYKSRRQVVERKNVGELFAVSAVDLYRRTLFVQKEIPKFSISQQEGIIALRPPWGRTLAVPICCGHQIRILITDVDDPLIKMCLGWREGDQCHTAQVRFGGFPIDSTSSRLFLRRGRRRGCRSCRSCPHDRRSRRSCGACRRTCPSR